MWSQPGQTVYFPRLLHPSCETESMPLVSSECDPTGKRMQTSLILLKFQHPHRILQVRSSPSIRVGHHAEAMCGPRGRLQRGWGASWPPAFPLSFSIMLIWLLLVTAIPHYYYSFQALNHSDGYNLTSTNLPNSSPLHFFNTKDKVGSFFNWLCNSSLLLHWWGCRKSFLWRTIGWRNQLPIPCGLDQTQSDRGLALSLTL